MSAFDDLVDQLNDLSDNFGDYTDSNDSTVQDLTDTVSEHDDSINTLEQTAGTLTFPLAQDTVNLIKNIFPTGTAKLVLGTVGVINPNVSPSSIIMLSNAGKSVGVGILSYAASAGSFTINSSNSGDASLIAYVIFS